MTVWLQRIAPAELGSKRQQAFDEPTLAQASDIIEAVKRGGEQAVRELAVRYGDIEADAPLVIERPQLIKTFDSLAKEQQALLRRTAERIRVFAELQKSSLRDVELPVPGGKAGHYVRPVDKAGCYAPGGRFPLPSSVLMTAIPARVAGVEEVWVASPRPTAITLAAAAIADADGLLTVGGAQAIAAFAYGTGTVPACDVIVGPGNRWVTAAKHVVSGHVGIDMLAGPSELVVVADAHADPAAVAADLLAQAEHDSDAQVILIALDEPFIARVEEELTRQLGSLPTGDTARAALSHSYAVHAESLDQAATLCNRVAPEHLQLSVGNPEHLRARLQHYGALFTGAAGAEVFGDYGAGPNHVLPTGGTARFRGGLSVFNFLRIATWLHLDQVEEAAPLASDAAALARLEGLEAHARAADLRAPKRPA